MLMLYPAEEGGGRDALRERANFHPAFSTAVALFASWISDTYQGNIIKYVNGFLKSNIHSE